MNLEVELRNYGVTSNSIRWLNKPASPELIEYLDLVEPRKPENLLPAGVAENQGRPLLFFLNAINPATPLQERKDEINQLIRRLAARGDRAYLAIAHPGKLQVVPITLSDKEPDWRIYQAGTGEAITLVSRLALGEDIDRGEPTDHDYVFNGIFELLKAAARRLSKWVDRPDTLSLVGRALFFRFLRDRWIIKDDHTRVIAPKAGTLLSCFDTAENAASTCQWLDTTFNGDFLPLSANDYYKFFDHVGRTSHGRIFYELGAIIRGEQHNDRGEYQLQFAWADLDFAHIPVGLLSQVHQAFWWEWEPKTAKETSVHYTPRNIAATLVGEVFDQLPNAPDCRVLDPACGASIFLVLAFRRLYCDQWRFRGQRPQTKDIRSILENQLVGFDTSDAALKLSALSLYLTAIELDPNPIPPEKLRFKKLHDSVLFNFRREGIDPDQGAVIGSLGSHLGNGFDNQFDVILSNPPWTSLPKGKEKLAKEYTDVSKNIIRRKDEPEQAKDYHNPDNAPDLPFIWKATEWCKQGGRIAMALPARILLKQEEIPRRARKTLFQLLEVTGIINGSNLSDTKVWPDMQQPFMLMFFRNRRPESNNIIQFITPYYDKALNKRGEIRIDSKSAQSVEVAATFEEPWLWKTLTVGTSLDADVIGKMRSASEKTLESYWEEDLKLASGKGYQIAAGQEQYDATHLYGLPNLDSTTAFRFLVESDRLPLFTRTTAWRPREEKIYQPPLLLVKASPGSNRRLGSALLCFTKIAYKEIFNGYSAAGHPDDELLVRYFHLFVHSTIWRYYSLMTSAMFGAERRKFNKSDLDECPIIPLEDLSVGQRKAVGSLSARLINEDKSVFNEIDRFFASLYKLDRLDLEVIHDTLEVSLPFTKSRDRACQYPTQTEQIAFCCRLESILRPFFKVINNELKVNIWVPDSIESSPFAPFGVLLLSTRNSVMALSDHFFQSHILPLANETGATQIIQHVDDGLAIGILNQYRFWTPSRARLLASEILRYHMSVFEA